jgi:hypothetical protein
MIASMIMIKGPVERHRALTLGYGFDLEKDDVPVILESVVSSRDVLAAPSIDRLRAFRER